MIRSRLAGRGLILLGIGVLAFNLRPAAVSVGPVLDEIREGLGMSAVEAGLLTALPVIAFAVFGATAPRLASRFGPHRLTLVSLLCVVVGLFGRSRVDAVPTFLGLSLLALAGMATANVLLPSLVRRHFPGQVGIVTGIYTTFLAIGLTSASVLTVPVSEHYDGWRSGLAVWSITAAIAVLPWLALVREDRAVRDDAAEQHPEVSLGDVGRTRLGRLMAAYFALQSLQAYAIFGWFAAVYRDAGFSGTTAGILLGVITGVSMPLSFIVPSLAGRMHSVAPLVIALFACYPVGYLGLIIAPGGAGAWVWAVIIGSGTATFPLVLVLIGLRSRTPNGTAALSGFTQSVGYLAAAIGPFGVGVLHEATDGWTVPLVALLVLTLPLLPVGLALSRPRYVEDELVTARGS